MSGLNEYLDIASNYERKGYIEEAIQLCEKCVQAFPAYKREIELEIAKINYRAGKKGTALNLFYILYQETWSAEIHDLILDAYYRVHQKEFEERYQTNYFYLNNYSRFFGRKEPLPIRYFPIFQDEDFIWYYDRDEDVFQRIERNRITIEKPEDVVSISCDFLWMEDILLAERMTRKTAPIMDSENAMLLVYQRTSWELLLQLFDLNELIEMDRIVFYDSLEYLEPSFLEEGIRFPYLYIGKLPQQVFELLQKSYRDIERRYGEYQSMAKKYYQSNSENVLEHIREGKPKIFFITSRFTTALQYHIRDCKKMVEDMGLETELFIEKDRLLTGGNDYFVLKIIAEFQPDMVFILDHFRHGRNYMEGLDSLVWVCWIQDTLPWIFSKSTVLKQKERDVVISIFGEWEGFQKIGYRKERLLNTPMVANSEIYHPYALSLEEEEKYGCDICFVCHWSDTDSYIKDFSEKFEEKIGGYIWDLYQSYVNYVRSTDQIFMKLEEFRLFIQEFMKRFYGIDLYPDFLDDIAEDMRASLNTRLYRELLVDWLVSAGYRNIKLWGKGWDSRERYRAFAMGPAENGETLSKILQASKIVVGNNIALSGASRVAETLLSGAFYMANEIPPEADTCNIRKWLKEGEEIVFFKNKEDFLDKIKFYLEHDGERIRMAGIGRQKALEKLTYRTFMENTIRDLAEMF